MATTVATIQSKVNQFIRDTSNNSVSASDRLSAISISVQELMTEFGFDQSNLSYELSFYDTLESYNITTSVPYFLEPVQLRREYGLNDKEFARLDSSDIINHIDNYISDKEFAIEHIDGDTWIIINFKPKNTALLFDSCDSLTNSGSWAVDSSNSDATNLTVDTVEYKQGSASFNFDLDVSQSANNKATIQNTTLNSTDLSRYEDLASWLMWVYIPDSTNTSSFTLRWGTPTVYWTVSATTDAYGESFVDGWNRIKFDWSSATVVGTPSSSITYLAIDVNYGAGQTDDTDYRIDDIKLTIPEKLKLIYNGWKIGRSAAGAALTAFAATSDIPFYSGQFDFFDNYVAHKSSAILFRQMGLQSDATIEDTLSEKEKRKLKIRFPSSRLEERKSFRPMGTKRINRFCKQWITFQK
jgi:hypothetical protein